MYRGRLLDHQRPSLRVVGTAESYPYDERETLEERCERREALRGVAFRCLLCAGIGAALASLLTLVLG